MRADQTKAVPRQRRSLLDSTSERNHLTPHNYGVIAALKAQGCDAVVLGCTELPLILHVGNSPLLTTNSTRFLTRAALRCAAATAA
jgi:aspartate/glutamate racemase